MSGVMKTGERGTAALAMQPASSRRYDCATAREHDRVCGYFV